MYISHRGHVRQQTLRLGYYATEVKQQKHSKKECEEVPNKQRIQKMIAILLKKVMNVICIGFILSFLPSVDYLTYCDAHCNKLNHYCRDWQK